MASIEELQPFITEPREDLATEYKDWLDLTRNEHKATLAKAAIALAQSWWRVYRPWLCRAGAIP